MELYIDTTEHGRLRLKLDGVKLDKAVDGLSESLLVELKKFLKKHKIRLEDLTRIIAKPGPGGFSSVRTGVVTANALAFALGIPKHNYLPKYDREPNITRPSSSYSGATGG